MSTYVMQICDLCGAKTKMEEYSLPIAGVGALCVAVCDETGTPHLKHLCPECMSKQLKKLAEDVLWELNSKQAAN